MSDMEKLLDELTNFGSLMTRGQLTQPRSLGPRIVGIAEEVRALAAQQVQPRTDLQNAPAPCLGWCVFGSVEHPQAEWRMIWRSHPKGEGWSAHGCIQDVRAWLPLPAPLPAGPEQGVKT